MFQLASIALDLREDFSDSVSDLMKARLRDIILLFGGLGLVVVIILSSVASGEESLRFAPLLLLILVFSSAAYTIRRFSILLSSLTWQIGFLLMVILATGIFQQPELLFLLSFLPMMATIILGWQAGLVSEASIGIVILVLPHQSLILIPYHSLLGPVMVGGILTGLLGWISNRALFTAMEWSFISYRQMRQNLEETRIHRGQLAHALKELDKAHYQLERAHASLVAAWFEADEAKRIKSDFVARVSHELRTPLNLILGYAEVMALSPESYDGQPMPAAYRSDIHALYTNARHLRDLVDDVLDLGRFEEGKIILANSEVTPTGLVDEVVNMVHDYIRTKGLDLNVKIQEDLPVLWIDHLRIRQVLLNLVVNATRFTEKGAIRIEVQGQDEKVLFRVVDTGKGIPSEKLSQVFDVFYTSDFSQDDKWHAGTGLGLPISKKFVELHDGQMGVNSQVGKGSEFWFSLPLRRELTPARTAFDSSNVRPALPSRITERIVVIVSTDNTLGDFLKRSVNGFHFLNANDLKEGAIMAEEMKAVAILTDQPRGGALSTGNKPIITFPWPNRRDVAAALGIQDYLTKPVTQQQLVEAIDRLEPPLQPTDHVLVVDDDPDIVRLFSRMLRSRIPPQNCLGAFSGEEALDAIFAHQPRLVLLDLQMHPMSGKDVLSKLVSEPIFREMQTIVISGKDWGDVPLRLTEPICLYRPQGFEFNDIPRTLQTLLGLLSEEWKWINSSQQGPATMPAG